MKIYLRHLRYSTEVKTHTNQNKKTHTKVQINNVTGIIFTIYCHLKNSLLCNVVVIGFLD